MNEIIPNMKDGSTVSGQSYQGYQTDPPDSQNFENKVQENNSKNKWSDALKRYFLHCGTRLSALRLEIAAFLFAFSYVMTKISSTSMILDKVCLVHFGYPKSICDDLQNHTEIKAAVEILATNYQLGHTLIQTAPAAVLACFIGPWSDKYGRKFPMVLALIGMILDGLGSTVCAHYLRTRVEFYYIPAVFTGMFGGPVSILAVVYSYASDMTPFSKRTMKYAFIEMAAGFSIPLGSTAGGWLFDAGGYTPVFFVSTSGLCLTIFWVVFVLKETRGMDNDDSWSVKLGKLFSCESFKESFKATIRERPHQGRKQILLLILSMCFIIVTINSVGDINFLFVHHQFNWGNTTYSTITAIYSVFGLALLVIVIPLLKKFRAGDHTLGLIGTISLLGKNVGIGLAWKPGIYHLASLFGLLGGCAPLAARARISKVASKEDLGKVFTFVATAESLLPIFTTILMTQIFNATLYTFPGMAYITLAMFLTLPLGVFIWMTCLPKLSYEDIQHEESERRNNLEVSAAV